MAVVELGQPRGDVQSLLPKVETTEPTIVYNPSAAKTLASEFLINRPGERLRREISDLHPEDAYIRGKMDARAMVLTMIGQVHILAIDPNQVNIYEPPMMDVRPLNSSQVNDILKSY